MRVLPAMSIVVATRDRLPYLRACVDSIRAQRYPRERMELVLVDDCSTDGTPGYLRSLAEPWIRVVTQPTRRRYAARNESIRAATGELIAITDDDCTVPEDWLASLAAAMEASGADALGGHIEAPGEALWIRYLSDLGFLHPNLLPTGDPSYVVTANACFRRAALDRVGPFDDALWISGSEDVDVSLRMRQRGMRLVYAPACRVSHWYVPDVREMLRRAYGAGLGWRVLLEKHRHWELWSARAPVALAWVVRRRGSLRGFLEIPDPELRPWYGLLNWLQQLCFLAGYVRVRRASQIAGAAPAAPAAASDRTRALLAMLSEGADAARGTVATVLAEMATLDVDVLLEAAAPAHRVPESPGAPDESMPPEVVADWLGRHRRQEREYLARNVAMLEALPGAGRTVGLPEIEERCHAAGVDVKRFLAWFGSLPRDREGALVDVRRPVRLPRGWRGYSRLAEEP